jgi:hypothetical protein
VTITAIGGAGADNGGVGDRVQATFPVGSGDAVTPGETLYVEVGGNGSAKTGGANGGGAGGSGDFGGPDGGGGGGASDVRTCSASSCALASSDTRLVVAAGGGGGGGGGGAGGNARTKGSAGSGPVPGEGGFEGTRSGPGSGGTSSSQDGGAGSRGLGGGGGAGRDACGDPSCDAGGGGGGGGGYFGGGGGGGGQGTSAFSGGGGGGGGADFASSSVTSSSSSASTGAARPSVTVTFKIAAAPSISIAKPGDGTTYARGKKVDSRFTCSEGAGGPGIASCLDQNGHKSGHRIDTSPSGRHAFTVTAISKDGRQASTTVHYTVAAPPMATISSPPSGRTYVVGQKVHTTFRCHEGKGGPGIASCQGSHGASPRHGTLNTSHPGPHTFTVTAISKDGQRATAMIRYRVKRPAPRLRDLNLTPQAFVAATGGPTVTPNPGVGTAISYRDSLAGHTTLQVLRCNGTHKRCSVLGSFSHDDRRGANKLHFSGRLGGQALSPGSYVLRATAALAGQKSQPVSATFQILEPAPACSDPDEDGDCDAAG